MRSGEEVMRLLLEERPNEVKVTESVVAAAAGNGTEVMRLLLEKRPNEVKVTEGVVTAAAANEGSGEKVMRLLRGH